MDNEFIKKGLGNILLDVFVELGRQNAKISEMLRWEVGDIIKFDKTSGETLDILVNHKPIASGEIIVIDDKFAIRVTDILSEEALIEKNKDELYAW